MYAMQPPDQRAAMETAAPPPDTATQQRAWQFEARLRVVALTTYEFWHKAHNGFYSALNTTLMAAQKMKVMPIRSDSPAVARELGVAYGTGEQRAPRKEWLSAWSREPLFDPLKKIATA